MGCKALQGCGLCSPKVTWAVKPFRVVGRVAPALTWAVKPVRVVGCEAQTVHMGWWAV